MLNYGKICDFFKFFKNNLVISKKIAKFADWKVKLKTK
jgi:hypothetical protein